MPKKPETALLVAPFSTEFAVLEILYNESATEGRRGLSSGYLLDRLNDVNELWYAFRGKVVATDGSLYGTVSRLKRKGLVIRAIANDGVVYQLTPRGKRLLKHIVDLIQMYVDCKS